MKLSLLPVACLANNVIVRNDHFEFNGKRLFLSGANQAWFWYGYDFGNGDWWKDPSKGYTATIESISRIGGNSMRFWLNVEGASSPLFDNNGFVIGTDQANSLIAEMSDFLNIAKSKNILVTAALWNGAVQGNQK